MRLPRLHVEDPWIVQLRSRSRLPEVNSVSPSLLSTLALFGFIDTLLLSLSLELDKTRIIGRVGDVCSTSTVRYTNEGFRGPISELGGRLNPKGHAFSPSNSSRSRTDISRVIATSKNHVLEIMTLPYPTPAAGSSPLPAISVSELLARGKPFVEFPTYSILDLKRETDLGESEGGAKSSENSNGVSSAQSASFADWLSRKLQIGHPFVIKGFNKLPEWDGKLFSIEGLIECSTRKSKYLSFCYSH